MKKRTSQPDFTAHFFDHFGRKPRKVNYEVRWGANAIHDLVFLRSLVHDATFRKTDIQRDHRSVLITMQRDCWEIPMIEPTKKEPYSKLYGAKSKLEVNGVRSMRWQIAPLMRELMLLDVLFSEDWWDHDQRFDVILRGDGWKLRLTVDSEKFNMSVKDMTTPKLWKPTRPKMR